METAPDLFQTPVFIVIFLFLFVSLFLFTHKKGKNASNKILGFLFLCYGLWVWDLYATIFLYDKYPYLAYIFNSLLWLIGPSLLIYTYSVIYNDFRFRKKYLFHLIPYLLVVLISIFTFHTKSIDYKRTYLEHAISDKSILIWGSSALILAHVLTYIIVAFKTIISYQNILSNIISNPAKIKLSWLKFMLIGSFVIFFSLISIVLNQYFRWEDKIPAELMYILIFLLLIFITSILFKSLKQPEIFTGIPSEEVRNIPKYAYSTLSKEESSKYTEKLSHFMESEKPYLDPNLSINDLSDKLDLNVRTLSQVINKTMGLRFFDYVNKYRIRDAKLLLEDLPDPKMTILEIMYQVGFNSKSSFNTAFKKFTGITPSEIKRRTKIGISDFKPNK